MGNNPFKLSLNALKFWSGSFSRSEYSIFVLFIVCLGLVTVLLAQVLYITIVGMIGIFLLVVLLAGTVRRLRHIEMSPFYIFVTLLPPGLPALLILLMLHPDPNAKSYKKYVVTVRKVLYQDSYDDGVHFGGTTQYITERVECRLDNVISWLYKKWPYAMVVFTIIIWGGILNVLHSKGELEFGEAAGALLAALLGGVCIGGFYIGVIERRIVFPSFQKQIPEQLKQDGFTEIGDVQIIN